MTTKLTPDHLRRRAIVYVRQSTRFRSATIVKVSCANTIWLAMRASWDSRMWKPSMRIWGAPVQA